MGGRKIAGCATMWQLRNDGWRLGAIGVELGLRKGIITLTNKKLAFQTEIEIRKISFPMIYKRFCVQYFRP